MGVTNFSISVLEKIVDNYHPNSVVELGSQNLYTTTEKNPPFASTWYLKNGFTKYVCIDLAGDNNALKLDLSQPIGINTQFDLVTDFGSGEHCVQMEGYESVAFHDGYINSIYPTKVKNIEEGFYNFWLNKFNLCKTLGIIVSENPKTKSWPDHGYSYLTENFYYQLQQIASIRIIELGEHPASGNDVDGWNIFCVCEKTGTTFPSFEEFSKLDIHKY